MSEFKRFMKENKVARENVTYAATRFLTDEKGAPLLWIIRPLSARENDAIRDECTAEVQVAGKRNQYRQKVNVSKYTAKMICASVVEPNLNNAELQDSYGVKTPEELLAEMVNEPGEYAEFSAFIQQLNGFTDLDDKVDEGKN